MQLIYIEGEPYTDDAVRVPLSSSALLFVLRYCQTDLFHVNFIKPSPGPGDSDGSRSEPVSEKESTSDEAGLILSCLVSGLSHSFFSSSDVPADVKNCALPVIQVVQYFKFKIAFLAHLSQRLKICISMAIVCQITTVQLSVMVIHPHI